MEKPYLEHIKAPSDISDFTEQQLEELQGKGKTFQG